MFGERAYVMWMILSMFISLFLSSMQNYDGKLPHRGRTLMKIKKIIRQFRKSNWWSVSKNFVGTSLHFGT